MVYRLWRLIKLVLCIIFAVFEAEGLKNSLVQHFRIAIYVVMVHTISVK